MPVEKERSPEEGSKILLLFTLGFFDEKIADGAIDLLCFHSAFSIAVYKLEKDPRVGNLGLMYDKATRRIPFVDEVLRELEGADLITLDTNGERDVFRFKPQRTKRRVREKLDDRLNHGYGVDRFERNTLQGPALSAWNFYKNHKMVPA